jgi:hypothetical protein
MYSGTEVPVQLGAGVCEGRLHWDHCSAGRHCCAGAWAVASLCTAPLGPAAGGAACLRARVCPVLHVLGCTDSQTQQGASKHLTGAAAVRSAWLCSRRRHQQLPHRVVGMVEGTHGWCPHYRGTPCVRCQASSSCTCLAAALHHDKAAGAVGHSQQSACQAQ